MVTSSHSFVRPQAHPAPSAIPGIRHATLAGSALGLRQLSVWQQELEPGAATPMHRHDCDEVVLCTGGAGELRVEGRPGLPFASGSTLLLPAGALHQLVNTGPEPLGLVAAFGETPVAAYLETGEALELPWGS